MSEAPGPLFLAVPTLNSERFLAATLRSLNANGGAVRWWLQDGGSTDRTLEIARSLARQHDVVVSEPDLGQADAINRAIHKMGGEIVGFINGDDCLLPEAAAHVVSYFAQHPNIDLLYGGVEWIDEDEELLGEHRGRISTLEEVLDIYGVWWKERQWVQPEVFYRRRLWEQLGGFNSAYHLAFDYDFWVRCFLAGARVAHLPEPLARFRRHAAQKSSAARDAADEIRAIVHRHLGDNPPIRPLKRWQLQAQLSYDHYQLGDNFRGGAPRPAFATALLRHPQWLLAPQARQRLHGALGRLLVRSK